MSFTKLKKYELADQPVPYTLYQLAGEPKLMLRPATERNKEYHNALLKRNAKLAARFRQRVKITREMLKENREHDKVLYAAHVIVGWEGIEEDDGTQPSFTPDLCRAFLKNLPAWIFDDLRLFAVDPTNFLQDDEPDEDEVEETAKN